MADQPDERRSNAPPLPSIILARHERTFVPARVRQFVQVFISTEATSGLVLLAAALAALVWVNSPWGDSYDDLWHTLIVIDLGIVSIVEDLQHLVNDGLMTVFFFVVGLEIKREFVHGELAHPRRAMLPVAGAIGGVMAPALIFTSLNLGGPGERGWGIPMATDIAFAVGVMAIAGTRVPLGLKIFVLGLAIVDDIAAILVIAVFYTSDLAFDWLGFAGFCLATIYAMNSRGVRTVNVYVAVGVVMWVAMLKSGVHPTITGVVLGLLTPARPFYDPATFAEVARSLVDRFQEALASGSKNDQENLLEQIEDLTTGSQAPLDSLEHALHVWVSYGVMPLFALANAGVELSPGSIEAAVSSATAQGVYFGLVFGKLGGIVLVSWLAVRLGIATLPTGTTWRHMVGAGLVCGIGFTVSLFITGLAFDQPELVDEAKVAILAGSLTAGLAGFLYLRFAAPAQAGPEPAALQAAQAEAS
ncbi:MAG TPA: Na+/H+ antiporter NhaA [Dehalococcoidia bacterium]|nr:Na+/H+ antiporter NhaA [Dehalococcoidia bacterium]